MRRTKLMAGFLLAMLMVVSACSGKGSDPAGNKSGAGSGASAADEKKTAITVVHGSEPRSLNPPIDIVKTTVNVELTIFDRLVDLDDNMKVIPGLADTWERTGEYTWRFHIRPGVKFHNNEEVDAESVAFTIKTYMEAKGGATPFFTVIKDAKAIDKSTLEVTTNTPNATVVELMTFLYVIPKGYYTQVGPEQFALKPVGTGPFTFVEWTKGDHITVKRNETYWKGPVQLSQITFRWAPEASSRVATLESGQSDLVVAVPAQMMDRITKSGNRAEQVRSMRKMFLEFNIFQPPFDNQALRKAVNHAVNVDELVQTVVAGSGQKTGGVLSEYFPSYQTDGLTRYEYSPDKVKQFLTTGGKASGLTFNLYHTIGRYPLDKEVATAIAGQLAKAGITANLKGMETGAFFDLLTSGKMDGAHLLSVAPLFPHEDNIMRLHFHSQGLYHYGYSTEGDKKIEAAVAISDPAQRKAAYHALEQYLMNDLISWVPLYDFTDIYGVSKRVQWKGRPDEIIDFRSVTVK